MDKAPDFGSGDCRFESCHGRFLFKISANDKRSDWWKQRDVRLYGWMKRFQTLPIAGSSSVTKCRLCCRVEIMRCNAHLWSHLGPFQQTVKLLQCGKTEPTEITQLAVMWENSVGLGLFTYMNITMPLRPEDQAIGNKMRGSFQKKIGLTCPCHVKSSSKIAKVKMRGKYQGPHADVPK